MKTPMMIQYLVGLCCLSHDPDANDIIIGDMVYDSAADKERDVDVTVTIKNENGTLEAFKAVEVKAEKKPLDVTTIEQLCIKMADMPNVTHKSIFSSSGYTDGARSKAITHSVDLYTIMPWETPIGDDFLDFKGVGTPSEFLSSFERELLCWDNPIISVVARKAIEPFSFQDNTPLLTSSGKKHSAFSNMKSFIDDILLRSTCILYSQEPANTILRTFPYGLFSQNIDYLAGPAWPHTHTIDVSGEQAYLNIKDKLLRIDEVTINGKLKWIIRKIKPEFFVFKNVINQEVFAGAAIADYGANDGRMFVMIFPERGRTLEIRSIFIPKKHWNMIKNLKLK